MELVWVECVIVDFTLLRRRDRNFLVIASSSIFQDGLQVIFLNKVRRLVLKKVPIYDVVVVTCR